MVTLRAETLIARVRDLGIANPRQIEQAKQELSNTQERFSEILVRQGLLRDADAGKRLAPQLGSIPQRLNASPTPTPKAGRVPAAMWRSQRLVPVREIDGKLLLATDDPFAVFALEFLGARCGCELEAVLIPEQDLAPLLEDIDRVVASEPTASPAAAQPPPAPAAGAPQGPPAPPQAKPAPVRPTGPAPAGPARTEERPPVVRQKPSAQTSPPATAAGPASAPTAPPKRAGTGTTALEGGRAPEAEAGTGDEPIIRLVDSMLAEAVRMRASDIHIEPGKDELRVRYRIDGVLHDVNSPPKALQGPIVSRIKIMGGLNIAEKRLPQDGRL